MHRYATVEIRVCSAIFCFKFILLNSVGIRGGGDRRTTNDADETKLTKLAKIIYKVEDPSAGVRSDGRGGMPMEKGLEEGP